MVNSAKLAEESEARFRTVIEKAPGAVGVARNGVTVYVNQKFVEMFGFGSAAEVVGQPIEEHWAPEYRDMVREHVRRSSQARNEVENYAGMGLRKDGSRFDLEAVVSVVEMPDGPASMAFMTDVTERNQSQRRIAYLNRVHAVLSRINELIIREKDLQKLFEAACRVATEEGKFRMAWVGLADPVTERIKPVAAAGTVDGYLDGLNIDFKDAARRGGPSGRALQTGEYQVCNDIDLDPIFLPWREAALQRGFRASAALPLKVFGQTKGVFCLYAAETGFFDAGELHLLMELAGDIGFAMELHQKESDRQHLEGQLRQAQKMEVIGQLASGVAHDFNNILAVILMQAELLRSSENASAEQIEYAKEINLAANRAAELTRQLLVFSRKDVLQLRDLDLDQSVNELVKMLRRVLGENIQLQFKFSVLPLFVRADPGMIHQILMNLAVNARDAMPGGGTLVIETAAVEVDRLTASHSPQAREGSFVCLTVSDTGCGMRPEVLPRIFEPFFTTKEEGKGTGLGLTTVYQIVQRHEGWLHVYSEPGHGTTFRIYLPRLAAPNQKTAEPSASENVRGREEKILVVEDDPNLRVATCKILWQLGYHVLDAANGQDALKIWRNHRNDVKLLLTDLMMPGGLGGKELAAQLLRDRPELKVVYLSGYSIEVIGKDLALEDGVNFLSKPFPALKLAKIVRERLDHSSS